MLTAAALNGPHFTQTNKKAYQPEQFLPKQQRDEAARNSDLSAQLRAFFQPKMRKK